MNRSIAIRPVEAGDVLAPAVARWVFDEWGEKEGQTYAASTARLFAHEAAPATQVAVDEADGVPLGVVAFTRFDDAELGAGRLWIDVLFVAPERRGEGIGAALVGVAEQLAAGFEEWLYVYTDVPGYYGRLGWEEVRGRNGAGCVVLGKLLDGNR